MHRLVPFAPVSHDIQIEGDIRFGQDSVMLRFTFQDRSKVVLDSPSDRQLTQLNRADELWKTTCFEAFWGVQGEPGYYELNISPNKPLWNLYRFGSYRQPQPPVPSFDLEIAGLKSTATSLECRLTGKVDPRPKEARLCMVVRTAGETFYFSTHHGTDKADFHARPSFTLK